MDDRKRRHDAKRSIEQPWRAWYRSKRWYRLRAAVLRRDSVEIDGRLIPKCQQTGKLLRGKHPAPDSPVADHIKPHKGDPDLFWNAGNIQTVSKQFHDSIKQRWEKRGTQPIGLDGWPIS